MCVQEPDIVNPENKFQKVILEEIDKFLAGKKEEGSLIEYFMIERFGLDVAIFMKWTPSQFTVRFFEFKAFVGSRKGGVGFGNQRGEGVQVDLLLLNDSKLSLANHFIRWILVDGTKPKGSSRFAIFDNIQAKNAAMGDVKKEKQNNFRIKDIMCNFVTWPQFIEKIKGFIVSKV